jgi:hypothetical protein
MLLASSGSGAFVEHFYLNANPDVAEAVAKGAFSSGLEHWELYGRQEGRTVWTKADITNHLADVRGYRSYLEICTPTSGGRYAEIDRSKYETCHRLMYWCPDDFYDNLAIDFRSPDFEIEDCIRQIGDRHYDVILVDSFHAYGTSLRDLKLAVDLLTDGGTVIVHDCNPPNEEATSSHFSSTSWAGVTYKAYLDFVTEREDLVYFTVDTDWGCGLIRKEPAIDNRIDRSSNQLSLWRKLGVDPHETFQFLQANKVPLLRLITVEQFLNDESLRSCGSICSRTQPR